ncbi:LOW QUALITY PROTEIN: Hypothetical protein PHPALM_28 [Phytophthora palmivora]|uniref:DDE Tnp4 domain-containing protein n=1 Tax=Phytophthora palmivora TaxID=4796 RepID=A0A2P4YVV7_9STRA|nr:LOW QUALITY PROTEIN: Hypothetical protein PHPALM_28 [Phytophthora palmivora]
MDALRESEDLRIHSPTESSSRVEKPATGVMKIIRTTSCCEVCLDDWVCLNRVPSCEEVPDDATFISGTIRCMAWTFRPFETDCAGSQGIALICLAKLETRSCLKWTLGDEILQLPSGYYCDSDNAYPLSDPLLVRYKKTELKTKKDSDFNFYLSKLRTRIEMSFGLLANNGRFI